VVDVGTLLAMAKLLLQMKLSTKVQMTIYLFLATRTLLLQRCEEGLEALLRDPN
jgi:hypothetical protein